MSTQTTNQVPAPRQAPEVDTSLGQVEWASVPLVNLLPAEITEGRRLRRLQWVLATGVLGAVALACAGTYWAQTGVDSANSELVDVKSRTASLQAEANRYAQAPMVLAQVESAEQIREQAMATDVAWYSYLNDIAVATPREVWMSSLKLSVSSANAGVPAGSGSTNPLAVPGVGTVTVAANADSFPAVAKWLETLNTVKGFDGATFSGAVRDSSGGSTVSFSGSVTITADALSHRFDRKAN